MASDLRTRFSDESELQPLGVSLVADRTVTSRIEMSTPKRDSHLDRFWLAYFRTSLLVLIGEIVVGMVYILLTPSGPHRLGLLSIGFVSLLIACSGLNRDSIRSRGTKADVLTSARDESRS